MTDKTYTIEELRRIRGTTNIEQIRKKSDNQIHAEALSDPDAQPLTTGQVTNSKRLGMTPNQFFEKLNKKP